MDRSRLLPVVLIPLAAIAAVLLLARTPWSATFSTLLGHGEEVGAHITIAGIENANVAIAATAHTTGMYITVDISGNMEGESLLTVPNLWSLEEVRGVHIKDIAKESLENRYALTISQASSPLRFTFKTDTSFNKLSFSHTAESPALLTLTHITLPKKEVSRTVKIVEHNANFPLL